MSDLKVGDVVTWRAGGKDGRTARGHIPIGIANCRIVEFGEANENGAKVAAARIKLPPMFNGEIVGAKLADLYRDED